MVDGTDWWPDLSCRRVAIIGAGPSLTEAQCAEVRRAGCYTIVVNESWRMAPWCDVHYICDWQYARARMPRAADLPAMRVIGTWPKDLPPDMEWTRELTLHRLDVRPGAKELLPPPQIGAGGNSCFQMLNWSLHCGARHVIFLGLDCHTPNMHWHGTHTHPEAPVQGAHTLRHWVESFERAAEQLRAMEDPPRVVNCSPGTALAAFPVAELEDELGEVEAA